MFPGQEFIYLSEIVCELLTEEEASFDIFYRFLFLCLLPCGESEPIAKSASERNLDTTESPRLLCQRHVRYLEL